MRPPAVLLFLLAASFLLGQPGAGAPASKPVFWIWEGKVTLEDRYQGKFGRHRWTGEYRVRLLERPTTQKDTAGLASKDLLPLELAYSLEADLAYDGPERAFVQKPVFVHGKATDIIRARIGPAPAELRAAAASLGRTAVHAEGDDLSPGEKLTFSESGKGFGSTGRRKLSGEVLDPAAAQPNAADPAVFKEWQEISNHFELSRKPGWYRLEIGLENDPKLFHGIRATGAGAPPADDPNGILGLIRWRSGLNVFGRLSAPDQREMRGAYEFTDTSVEGSDTAPAKVKVSWELRRTPRTGLAGAAPPGPGPPPTNKQAPGGGLIPADLEVKLQAAPPRLAAGAKVTYVLTIRNLGPGAAPGTNAVLTLPPGARLVSATASVGRPRRQGQTVQAELGLLERDGSATVQVVIVTARKAGPIATSGTAYSGVVDPRQQNNAATANVFLR